MLFSVRGGGNGESVCKPGSVPALAGGDHPSAIVVADDLVRPTRELGRTDLKRSRRCTGTLLALLQVGFTEPMQSPALLVVSYTTFSPLPTRVGGLFSVALSRGSLRVGVTHHLVLWSPDFPRHRFWCRGRPTDSPYPGYALG